jgi:hypothetical protein
MAGRKLKDTAHAGGIFLALVHLHHVLNHGYDVLKRLKRKAKPRRRERVEAYLVLHCMLHSLGHVRETVNLLILAESSLEDVFVPFKDDLALWARFRNDAAHLIERTHTVPSRGQNDPVIAQEQYGYDTDVLGYDDTTDTIRTGRTDTMVLRAAIDKVEVIMVAAYDAINNGYGAKTIQPPPRYRGRK